MRSLLIHGATVLSVDRQQTIYNDGAVYVEDDRIVAVGDTQELLARYANAHRIIDGTGKVICPGFISTHTHVGFTIFRGRAEDAGLACVTGHYLPMATVLSRDERRAVGSLTYAELLRSGVTTVVEMEPDADVFAPFVEQLGSRSAMGIMIRDLDVDTIASNEYRFEDRLHDEQFRQALSFAEQWDGAANGRITALFTPDMTISSSPKQLDACRHSADALGLRLSTHLGWGETETQIVQQLHGLSPCQYLHDHGLLSEDVIVAHCYALDEDDAVRFASSGAHLAHCPLMNSVRGYIAPALDFHDQGVNVSLGIDNMFGDYFDVIRACLLMARVKRNNPTAMLAPLALEMATMGGARALGRQADLGSIEVGKKADLVVIDYRRFGLIPTLDPVQNLVYHAHASNVDTVIVDGSVVVDHGQLVHAEETRLLGDAELACRAAWQRFETKYGGTIAGN